MKKICLCLSFLTLYTVAFAQQPGNTDARLKGLDALAEKVLKDWHAAGFAIAIVEKNKVIYAKGFGYRDVEKKLPVTPNTQFAIGSCTKSFTSAMIGLLNQEGKVDIDKPVRDYLPELKFSNSDMNNQITLRDMMCHRTGLSRYDISWYMFNTASKDSLIRRIAYQEPSAPIRTKWQYSNWMFLGQGVVTEKITGKSWDDNITERFFQKLDMKNSNPNIDGLKNNAEPALGYGLENDSVIRKMDYYDINAMGPAGSINSSVNDMTNWVITWINGGKFKGKEIMPSNYVKDAISAQMVLDGSLPDKAIPDVHSTAYGLGWMLTSYRGHYQVEHGGNINGFSASTGFFPTDSIGIIILTNQNNSYMPAVLRSEIADMMLGLKDFNWNNHYLEKIRKIRAMQAAAKNTKVEAVKGADISRRAEDFAGYYENKGYGKFEIVAKGDSLFAQLPDNNNWYLLHYCYDLYDPIIVDKEKGINKENRYPWRFNFQTDEKGNISQVAIPMESAAKPILFTKTEKALALDVNALQKYEGEYDLHGQVSKVYRKGGEQLFLTVPGQPEYTLVPVGKDKFSIKGLDGYNLQFTVNDKQEVTEAVFLQPNGTYKATKKK